MAEGRPESFAAFLVRLARVLKIKKAFVQDMPGASSKCISENLGNVRYVVEQAEYQWRRRFQRDAVG